MLLKQYYKPTAIKVRNRKKLYDTYCEGLTDEQKRLLGKAVQVEPMKLMLRAPGTQRLKLKCDEPLSNCAFKFNLRRYCLVSTRSPRYPTRTSCGSWRRSN